MRRFFHRLATFLRPGSAERELAREVSAHLALLEAEYQRRGMSATEARHAARRALGGVEQAKELQRSARSFLRLEDARLDVKHTLRSLRRTPGFTVVAVFTLALGIGANTAMFSVVNAMLLRPLPFPNADRIVRIFEHVKGPLGGELRQGVQRDELVRLRSATVTLSDVDAYGTMVELRLGRDEDVELQGARVSHALLSMLGATPVLGRLYDERESEVMEPVVVLSYRVWQRHFGGRADVLGQPVIVDSIFNMGPARRVFSIVGVMAEGFTFPTDQTQFWVPLNIEREGGVATVARLKEDVSVSAARQEVATMLRAVRGDGTEREGPGTSIPRVEIVPLRDEMVASVRPALYALVVAVVLLLLIACANVANLLLARSTARQREIAVRAALGAGRARLMRQMVTEGLVLAFLGGIAGSALAFWATHAARTLFAGVASFATLRQVGVNQGQSITLPRVDEIHLDATAFALTAAVCLVTGVLFGVASALRHHARTHMAVLRQGAASAAGFGLFRRDAMRGVLVLAQIALAVTLLVGGGLLVHSFLKLATVDQGYDPSEVLTFQVRMPPGRYTNATLGQFSENLMARLEAVPAVRAAGYALTLPMVPMVSSTPLRVSPGEQLPPPSGSFAASIHYPGVQPVSRSYVQAMGIRVVQGSGFGYDGGSRRRGVLINETLARGRFPGTSPVGTQVYFGAAPTEILGVVADVRQQGADIDPEPQVLVDVTDWGMPQMGFLPNPYYVVRAAADAAHVLPAIRDAVRQLESDALLDNVAPLEQLVAASIARPRAYALLFGTFATIAAMLAAVGVYGVMAYAVTQSTREIGVRIALGAPRTTVLALVLGRAARLSLIGMSIGIAGALATTRYLQGMIFGLSPLDASTFLAVALLFGCVAMLAAYVPARRATGVDPLAALRHE